MKLIDGGAWTLCDPQAAKTTQRETVARDITSVSQIIRTRSAVGILSASTREIDRRSNGARYGSQVRGGRRSSVLLRIDFVFLHAPE